MKAFADQLSVSGGASEPDAEAVGAAKGSMVDSDTILPEEAIERSDH